ncbi:MAG: GNAT family N-acetyltransferase [Butyrivibrio sp.]|uniref:GNAT family N-acetyltransferase n=1 Tax=Butyrivibrio sp. TaxID=28121 RepID=UPI0025C250AF|nr:GNAT family N-acetyltransferase [Butyrivibrio sp.]MBQ6588089.1 GNAT family N-acetyltransferase [Butyrivibrio sp.]
MDQFENISIETPDLILKKAHYEDWEPLYRNIWCHPESAKYMLWNVTTSEEDAKARIIRTIEFEKKEKYGLIVYLKSTMEAIGFACMREVEPEIYEETGIAVGPEYVRKGYGRQILTALCDEAKRQGVREFRASYRKMNLASKGMIEACGFEFDFESEEKVDPRNGEKYTVVNCKKKWTKGTGL